jgi:hypothetical protein
MTVNAHFDGKVIVPDVPLGLRPNQALIVHIELIEAEAEESALTWIAANAVDSDALPTISPINTIITSTATLGRTRAGSGGLLRRHF